MKLSILSPSLSAVLPLTLWFVLIVGLALFFWLKPRGFFPERISENVAPHAEIVSMLSSLLAVMLFVTCFLIGIWMGIAELRGLV